VTGYRLGYARGSTVDQTPASHLDALNAAGCHELFADHASGTTIDRPALTHLAVDQLRTLVAARRRR